MMSNEEWDRQVECLLRNQAQFDIDIAEVNKTLAQVADNLANQSFVMAEGFEKVKAEQGRTDAQLQRLGIKVEELTQSQKLTDEQLRKFIAKVDRLTGEGHNGFQN